MVLLLWLCGARRACCSSSSAVGLCCAWQLRLNQMKLLSDVGASRQHAVSHMRACTPHECLWSCGAGADSHALSKLRPVHVRGTDLVAQEFMKIKVRLSKARHAVSGDAL
jgi:hypothetical protein